MTSRDMCQPTPQIPSIEESHCSAGLLDAFTASLRPRGPGPVRTPFALSTPPFEEVLARTTFHRHGAHGSKIPLGNPMPIQGGSEIGAVAAPGSLDVFEA